MKTWLKKWCQNDAKRAPKGTPMGPQGAHKNDLKSRTFQGPSLGPQNGAKMEPKWSQSAPVELPGVHLRKHLLFDAKMEPKWNQSGPKMEPQNEKMRAKNEFKNMLISRHDFLMIFLWFGVYFWIDFEHFFVFFSFGEIGFLQPLHIKKLPTFKPCLRLILLSKTKHSPFHKLSFFFIFFR